jgi:hypothetical protein
VELDLGARMVNAARMAAAVHLFESVRERIRLREDAAIGRANAEGQEDLLRDSAQDDDGNVNDSLWQRPRTGGAGLRTAADDDGQPAFPSARRVTFVTEDDEGGQVVAAASVPAIAGDARASARPLPTVTARSPRTPRLPADGGAPPHAGGALPRPAGLIGIGCGCAADRVRPPCVGGSVAWAEGAD